MANATRTLKSYALTQGTPPLPSGSPLIAEAITVANGAEWFDDGAIPSAKVTDANGVIGTAVPVAAVSYKPFNITVDLAAGASADDTVTAVVPRKCQLIGATVIKTAGASDALGGDKVHASTAAGGLGTKAFESSLSLPGPAALPDTNLSVLNTINDAGSLFAAGATIFFGRTQVTSAAARVTLHFMPVA